MPARARLSLTAVAAPSARCFLRGRPGPGAPPVCWRHAHVAALAGGWRADHRRAGASPRTRAEPDRPDPDRAGGPGRVVPGRAGRAVRHRAALPLLTAAGIRPGRDFRCDHRRSDGPPSEETIAG